MYSDAPLIQPPQPWPADPAAEAEDNERRIIALKAKVVKLERRLRKRVFRLAIRVSCLILLVVVYLYQ